MRFTEVNYENREIIGRTHTAPAEALQQKNNLMQKLPSTEHVVKITVDSGDVYFIKKTATTLNQYIPIELKYQMVDSCDAYREELSNILGDWWDDFYYDMGNVEDEGNVEFNASKKPERLIFRILNMFTSPDDWVLDSFLGSGTTAAVAHKMGRRWIGIELGDHCYTHCMPRLQDVINGTDNTGISSFVDWQGGGGFRFFELGESLIQKDKWGQEIINKNFNAEMLAQALCKIEGFIYAPSKEEFFIHGHSTENDFIYVTTNFMTAEYLKSISEQLGEKRSLLICCKGFESSAEFSNLTVKKIPKAVLDKCEWGHDDYSLNVANLPMSASVPVQAELFDDIEGDEK